MNTDNNNSRSVGRPKGPEKKFWAKRLTEEQREMVEDILKAPRVGCSGVYVEQKGVYDGEFNRMQEEVKLLKREVDVLKVERDRFKAKAEGVNGSQIEALLANVEELTKEVADLKVRLDRTARMTDDEKCRGWIWKYDQLKGSLSKGEFDQG